MDLVVEDSGSSMRAVIIIERDSNDGQEVQAKASVEAQLAMERVGWTFLRISATRCLLATAEAIELARHFLAAQCGFRTRMPAAPSATAEAGTQSDEHMGYAGASAQSGGQPGRGKRQVPASSIAAVEEAEGDEFGSTSSAKRQRTHRGTPMQPAATRSPESNIPPPRASPRLLAGAAAGAPPSARLGRNRVPAARSRSRSPRAGGAICSGSTARPHAAVTGAAAASSGGSSSSLCRGSGGGGGGGEGQADDSRDRTALREVLAAIEDWPDDNPGALPAAGSAVAQRRAEAEQEVERIMAARRQDAALRGDTVAERRRDFRRIARLLHPDKGFCSGERAGLALRRALAAYQALG